MLALQCVRRGELVPLCKTFVQLDQHAVIHGAEARQPETDLPVRAFDPGRRRRRIAGRDYRRPDTIDKAVVAVEVEGSLIGDVQEYASGGIDAQDQIAPQFTLESEVQVNRLKGRIIARIDLGSRLGDVDVSSR